LSLFLKITPVRSQIVVVPLKYSRDFHCSSFCCPVSPGNLWIKGLVDELKRYDNQRNIYPTHESYIPNLSSAYKTFAEKVSQFDAQRPKVESITEFTNNDVSVSS
jgi:hypothetical protein